MSEPEFEGNPGFSPVSVLIAVLLTIFLGTASTYVALFISALPWPIVFSAITSSEARKCALFKFVPVETKIEEK